MQKIKKDAPNSVHLFDFYGCRSLFFFHLCAFRVPNHVNDDGNIHDQGDEAGNRKFVEQSATIVVQTSFRSDFTPKLTRRACVMMFFMSLTKSSVRLGFSEN